MTWFFNFKRILLISLFYFSILSKSQSSNQIAFKRVHLNDPFITACIYTEDFNADGVMDFYGALYQGDPKNMGGPLFDPSIVNNGFYMVIRRANGTHLYRKRIIGYFRGYELYDFNNDGKKDLMATGIDSIYIYYRVDSFNHSVKSIGVKGRPAADHIVTDMNNDGLLDIVSASTNVDSQYFYILYQTPNGDFNAKFLPNYCYSLNDAVKSQARLLIGDLNHDGKKDLMCYSPVFYNKLYFYFQQDSITFSTSTRSIPGSSICAAILDNNHDGRDDILIEFGDNYDLKNQKLLLIPQTPVGFTSLQYLYTYSDNYYNGGYLDVIKERRLIVDDLNCDGYPEVYRFDNQADYRVYIHDTKFDTTYDNPKHINLSLPFGNFNVNTNMGKWYPFNDFDGDGKKDLIIYGYIRKDENDTETDPYSCLIFKNVSINDQSTKVLLSTSMDTNFTFNFSYWYNVIKVNKGIIQDTISFDTTYFVLYGKSYPNPDHDNQREPAYEKYTEISVNFIKKYFYSKNIYLDSVFLISGNCCGGAYNDTFKKQDKIGICQLVYKSDTLSYTLSTKLISVTFSYPSTIYSTDLSEIKTYPTIVKDYVKVEIPSNIGFPKLNFYNQFGNEIFINKLNENTYDVSMLPNGIYFIQFVSNDGIHSQKFIIER